MKNLMFAGWLVVSLTFGFSQYSIAEPSGDHSAAETKGAEGGKGRPATSKIPLPEEYVLLEEALGKVNVRGLTIAGVKTVDGKEKEVIIPFNKMEPMKKWIGTLKEYRQLLTSCIEDRDQSADQMGRFIDDFIFNLQSSITEDPANASGIAQKQVLAFSTQISRFFEEKNREFSANIDEDTRKIEEAVSLQTERLARLFVTAEESEAASSFDVTQQRADDETKSIVEKMDEAVRVLQSRAEDGEKACLVSKSEASEEEATEEETSEEKAAKEKEAKEKEAKEKAEKEAKEKKETVKPNPTPITGGNEEPGDGNDGNDGNNDDGNNQNPADEFTGDDNNNAVDQNVDPGLGGFDPNAFVQDPNANVVQDDLNVDDLLRGLQDRFADLEDEKRDEQDRIADQLKDALDAQNRLADDIARAQLQAVEAQNDGADAALGEALKALGAQDKGNETPVIPPVTPPTPAPIIPPSDSGNQAQPFFPPPSEEPFAEEPLPPQIPFFPPPQQGNNQPLVIAEEKSQFEDDYLPRRTEPVAPVNPQASGLLELARIQQQLLAAQQQAQFQYGQQNGQLNVNVNSMAGRLQGGAANFRGGSSNAQQRLQQLQGGNSTTQSSGNGVVPQSRSTTVPSGVQRGSLR